MSRNRVIWSLSLWLLFGAGSAAHGQLLQPFVDPASFDMDYRWFTPLYEPDVISADRPNAHTGPYFAYSRSTLSMSRPDEQSGSEDLGDWTWGNRYDFGYMLDDGGGWAFTYWNVHSPRDYFITDFVNRNDEVLADLLGDPVGSTRDTLNDAEVRSFEANRVWRIQNRYSWVMFEPFLGARYIRVKDRYDQQDYLALREGAPATGPANGALSLVQQDIFTNDMSDTDNDLFGGQFGVRMTTWRGRWRLLTDIRGLLYNNFQNRERDVLVETNTRVDLATYDDNGNLDDITVGAVTLSEDRTLRGRNKNHFVWGGELRLEAAYDVTAHIAIVGGLEALVLADGVGRGAIFSSESFTLVGGTLGFSLNR